MSKLKNQLVSYYVEFWQSNSQWPEFLKETEDNTIELTSSPKEATLFNDSHEAASALARYVKLGEAKESWKYDTIEIHRGRPLQGKD